MSSTDPAQVEIKDPASLVFVMASLKPGSHALRIKFNTAVSNEDYSIAAVIVQASERTVILTFAVTEVELEPLLAHDARLYAENEDKSLCFFGLKELSGVGGPGRSKLQCRFPERLIASDKRSTARVSFINGMRAKVTLSLFPNQSPVTARIVDLSVGGCLLKMPMETGMLLRIDQPAMALGIEFPNGDELRIEVFVRHVHLANSGPGFVWASNSIQAPGKSRKNSGSGCANSKARSPGARATPATWPRLPSCSPQEPGMQAIQVSRTCDRIFAVVAPDGPRAQRNIAPTRAQRHRPATWPALADSGIGRSRPRVRTRALLSQAARNNTTINDCHR